MTTELRGYAVKVTDLEGQVRYKEEALAAANSETANLHKALRSVDAERDQLQVGQPSRDGGRGEGGQGIGRRCTLGKEQGF
jgi:hypothetical protein